MMKKKLRNIIALLLVVVLAAGNVGTLTASAAGKKPTSVEITTSKKTAYVGSKFELKAKISKNSDDDYLRWSIVGTEGIIKITDDDTHDDEVEFKALKVGTTKVKCYVKGTDLASYATVTVKKPTYSFSRVGAASQTVYVGDEFELEVKKSGGTKDSHLKWSIKDTSIVKFADKDKTGDDVELKAKAAGTTTVTCTNTKTDKKISYKITVKKKPSGTNIGLVGNASVTVKKGEDIELEVRKGSSVKEKDLKWSIKDTSILKFEDGEKYGSEVELEAKKVGTTKVICTNLKTEKKITYTVEVVK